MRTSVLLLLAACRVTDPRDPDAPADTDTAAPDTGSGDTDSDGSGDPRDFEDPSDTAGVPARCESACEAGAAALVCGSGESYPTVQAALDASVADDVVVVCPGTWTESLTVPAHPLTLEGAGVDVSILDGGGVARVLEVELGGTLTLRDLTVQNGWNAEPGRDWPGAGLYTADADLRLARVAFRGNVSNLGGAVGQGGGTLVVVDSVFENNQAPDAEEGGGGAIRYVGADTVVLRRTTFQDNYSGYWGGAYFQDVGPLLVEDSVFIGNQAGFAGESTRGGGLYHYAGPTRITGSRFEGNSGGTGAAAGLYGVEGNIVTDTVFVDNLASGAGALALMGHEVTDTPSTVERCTFEGNVAAGGAAIYAGLWAVHTIDVTDTTFTGNSVGSQGGAVSLDLRSAGHVSFERCTFRDNDARSQGGAVMWTGRTYSPSDDNYFEPTFEFRDCTLEGNTSAEGGALHFSHGLVTVEGSALRENVASVAGGALHVSEYAEVTVIDSDWGTDASDNAPSDVNLDGAWGAAATFTCTSRVCE